MHRVVLSLLFLVSARVLAENGTASAEPPDFLPPAVAASVREAWRTNLGLAQREVDLELAGSRLAEVKGTLGPQVDLVARYTRADGGRTIDLPLGDLLNGAYATLNDYLRGQGRAAQFPTLSNQSIPLLRREEQETKVRVTQVLWRPELTRLTRASRYAVEAREAQVSAYRRELAHLTATAHLQAWAAESALRVWTDARELCAEAVRVNEVLLAHDKVTRDAVLRAKAEAAKVEESWLAASRDAQAARMQVNFLLNRDLTLPVETGDEADADKGILKLNTLRGARPALGRREELVALELAVKAAEAQQEAVSSRLQPTVGLQVEGGIQGEDYRTNQKASFVQGSIVAEVNLWDNRRRRQQTVQAKAEVRRLELERQQVALQLNFQLEQAWNEFLTADAALKAALQRSEAATESFTLVQRRQQEGVANQLAFLDARQEHTSARLQAAIARYRLLIAASALTAASGTSLSSPSL